MGDEHAWMEVLAIVNKYPNPVVIVSATARTTRQLVTAAELAVTDHQRAIGIAAEIKQRHEVLVNKFMAHYPDEKTRQARDICRQWIEQCISELHRQLADVANSGTLRTEHKDAIASMGEQLSSRLFAVCGSVFGLNTSWIDAREIIKTDSDFGNANPDVTRIGKSVKTIRDTLEAGNIPIMGGYYGEDGEGTITTLGFEGSDFTASLIGSALDAEAIEIWTDVSGIYTFDPRIVDSAHPIAELSFEEATELAYFGAKVLHPSTMKPASKKQIPILVKNIFEPLHPGTKIYAEATNSGIVKAMACLDDIVITTVTSNSDLTGYHFLSEVFKTLNEYHLPVAMITTTAASVSIALKHSESVTRIGDKLERLGEVTSSKKHGLINLIGCSVTHISFITGKILQAVPETEISMFSFDRNRQNIILAVSESELIASVKVIHDKLFTDVPV